MKTILLIGGLILAASPPLSAQQEATPPLIDSIVVITHDVFTPEEVQLNPAFGLMNGLHVKTRPEVVRRELLLKVGQPFDPARRAETLRNLRRVGLFNRVTMDTARVDGKLVVYVTTSDVWTTSIGLNARSTGGTFTWSTSLSEANVLGTGNSASIGYAKEVDRNAVIAAANVRRLLGSAADGGVTYQELSDGHVGGAAIQVPFRAFSDRRSMLANGSLRSQQVLQFRDGALLQRWHRHGKFASFNAQLAPRASTRGYARVGLRGQVKSEQYIHAQDTLLGIPDTLTAAFGMTADFRLARFIVVNHYNGFARDEDVDLSARVGVGALLAAKGLGYPRTGSGFFIEGQMGWPIGASFMRVMLSANGLFTSAGLDSGQARASFTTALRLIPRQPTILYVIAGIQRNPAPGAEFDLGHSGGGPRAFGPHSFNGTRMWWGTLEHRVFLVDEALGVLGIGAAAFLDYGGAWYPDERARRAGNIGFGLRIGPTRATGSNLGRFDLAYKFGDGVSGKRWVFSFGTSFVY
ncbi:MAG: hypothetical protein HY700_02895 [Gemmatimonadetes bacterium]|nr:hypothetical protein [Gemmatimonadota bacterium]